MARHSRADTERALRLLAEQRADDDVRGYDGEPEQPSWSAALGLGLAFLVLGIGSGLLILHIAWRVWGWFYAS